MPFYATTSPGQKGRFSLTTVALQNMAMSHSGVYPNSCSDSQAAKSHAANLWLTSHSACLYGACVHLSFFAAYISWHTAEPCSDSVTNHRFLFLSIG